MRTIRQTPDLREVVLGEVSKDRTPVDDLIDYGTFCLMKLRDCEVDKAHYSELRQKAVEYLNSGELMEMGEERRHSFLIDFGLSGLLGSHDIDLEKDKDLHEFRKLRERWAGRAFA